MRPRPAHRIAIALLSVPLLITACTGGEEPAEPEPVVWAEHTVRDEAPPPLAEEGPTAGRFADSWQRPITVSGHSWFALAGGNVIVGTDERISALEGETGEDSWSYREPGRRIGSWAATADTIVVSTTGAIDNKHVSRLIGLDAGTGEFLWEKRERLRPDPPTAHAGLLAMLGGTDNHSVIVATDDNFRKHGIDARTGEVLWNLSANDLPQGCELPAEDGSDSSGELLMLTVDCSGNGSDGTVYGAVEAETGKPRWFIGNQPGELFAARKGTSVRFAPHEPPALIDRKGEEFFSAEDRATCPCAILDRDGSTLLSYRGQTEDRHSLVGRLVDVDENGDAKPFAKLPESFHNATSTSDKLYGIALARPEINKFARRPVPAPLLLSTVGKEGKVEHSTLPTAVASGTGVGWFTAAGDRIFLVMHREDGDAVIRSFDHTDDSAAPGGVDADAWPDSCELLSVPGLRDQEPYSPAGKEIRIGDVSMPKASCIGRTDRRDDVVLDVVWVAHDEGEAEKLFTEMAAETDSPAGADQEHHDEAGNVWLRVGSVIVRFSPDELGEGQRDDVLHGIVTNLRELS
ncbi:PQQ-binding-like beta-propeller repeat protein [Saccharomonospora sp. NPDC006951]